MPTDIERLRELLAAGTAGPWRAEPSCDEDENVYWSEDLNAPVWLVATPLTNDTATWLIDHISESNATLITETINALPALLEEVERLRKFARYVRDIDPENPAPLFAGARHALA